MPTGTEVDQPIAAVGHRLTDGQLQNHRRTPLAPACDRGRIDVVRNDESPPVAALKLILDRAHERVHVLALATHREHVYGPAPEVCQYGQVVVPLGSVGERLLLQRKTADVDRQRQPDPADAEFHHERARGPRQVGGSLDRGERAPYGVAADAADRRSPAVVVATTAYRDPGRSDGDRGTVANAT
ncbi:MAG TPA: hypothetical protein VMM60_14355, partial [Ilumatobacter sp.]|nr:hypothetical protein [Ilumatobacter sp.]